MLEELDKIFEELKRKKEKIKKETNIPQIYFVIDFDNNGAYLKVTDDKLREIKISSSYFQGAVRDVLNFIENLQANEYVDDLSITDINKLYLFEHDFLLDLLKKCDNVVTNDFQKIDFVSDTIEIVLYVDELENYLKCQIKARTNDNSILENYKLITQRHVFFYNKIIPILPIGNKFKDLEIFSCNISKNNLEKYLSIIFSYFQNISIEYKNYDLEFLENLKTKPCLIFENVDEIKNLHLRISQSIDNFDFDIFDSYDIKYSVIANDLKRTIEVKKIETIHLEEYFYELKNSLLKYNEKDYSQFKSFQEELSFILDEEIAYIFLEKELSNILSKYNVFGSEKLKLYNIKTIKPKLSMNLSYGVDLFEGEAFLDFEGQVISLFDAINLFRKNLYIPLNDGNKAILNKSYINKLQRIFKKQKDEKVRLSFFDIEEIEDEIDYEHSFIEDIQKYKKIFLGFNKIKDIDVKIPKVKAKLREYQLDGFKWLKYLEENNLGGCLADEMGLGKTLQTIILFSSIYPQNKKSSLIIVPKSLIFNWEDEINKFNKKLTYYIYYGNNKDIKEAIKNNLIITTYSTIRNNLDDFKDIEFYYIILDEAQNIKNLETKVNKAVNSLNSVKKLALSGTPIENNLSELYSLFRFLNKGMFGTFEDFNSKFISPIIKEGDKDVLDKLSKKIKPFILRRLKQDVLKDLPDKIEQIIKVEMNREQKELYEKKRYFYNHYLKEQIKEKGLKDSQLYIIQAINELRQIASIPESKSDNTIFSNKRVYLIDQINELIQNKHKIVIFTYFLDSIEYISQDLDKNDIKYLIMTGNTKNRKEITDNFNNDKKIKVLLMTIKTGGVGLNLTSADYVFIYEPWWNKSIEDQAIDRLHRMGQKNTVFSYKIISKDSIEEKILLLQEKKKIIFDSLISSESLSSKNFSEKDLDFIFS